MDLIMKILNIVKFFSIIFQLSISLIKLTAQTIEPISDFYLYANSEWLKHTELPPNYIVINQSGLLWKKIENKSLEILNNSSTYNLDNDYLYTLQQLINFYYSTDQTLESQQKRVVAVQKNFPIAFGIIFSEITINQHKEEMIREIIDYLKLAYRYKIETTDIIGERYKKFYLNKLDNLEFDIGSPPISDFPEIPQLSKTSYSNNLILAKSYRIELEKIHTDWRAPYETDCFYYAGSNKIVLNAGMLFDFDSNDDISYLFATLGRTIAHEMTHAFDWVGEKYDKYGKRYGLIKKIISGTMFDHNNRKYVYQSLIHQFNAYSFRDSLYVDGKKTLQENFADLGGVEVSILALKMFIKDKCNSDSDNTLNASLKKYFIHYTQFWKEKATLEYEFATYKRIHTPQKFRAIGPIYNQNEFYQLYNIDSESDYYIPKSERVSIW